MILRVLGLLMLPPSRGYRANQPLDLLRYLNFAFDCDSEIWSARLDLNQRPFAPQANALPDCATRRLYMTLSHFDVGLTY